VLYLDAVTIFTAAQHGLPLHVMSYQQMKTSRSEVKDLAERLVGRTELAWDENMASAIAVAWCAGDQPTP
jgi:hypothetical protein